MNCAPHRAESWVRHHDRLLLSDTEQFLAAPLPVLLNRAGVNNLRQPAFGLELRLLIDRNAIGDGDFLITPASAQQPWIGLEGWLKTATGLLKVGGAEAGTPTVGSLTLKASQNYNVTFSLALAPGQASIRGSATAACGGTLGTARSTVGTFTETIACAAGSTIFFFDRTDDFYGEIRNVTVYPATAPGDLTVNLYSAADALTALRSTEPFTAIVLPSATKTLIRSLRWVDYSAACSGLDVGLDLAAAYTAGKVYASLWTRRYWWGQPASPG